MNILGYNNVIGTKNTLPNSQALLKSHRTLTTKYRLPTGQNPPIFAERCLGGLPIRGLGRPHAHHARPQHPKPDKTGQNRTAATKYEVLLTQNPTIPDYSRHFFAKWLTHLWSAPALRRTPRPSPLAPRPSPLLDGLAPQGYNITTYELRARDQESALSNKP